jgi:hypothetical protein
VKDANVSPEMENASDGLAGYPSYTILDAMSGYDQIPLSAVSRDLTAIWTQYDSLCFLKDIQIRKPLLKESCHELFLS